MNKKKVIKKVKEELKMWKDLKKKLLNKLKGKTYIKEVEKETNWVIKERSTYLKNLLENENKNI